MATRWPRVRDTCHNLGWSFDAWQDGAGRLILAVDIEGLYAADTVVLSIPRQVGKTRLIGMIVFALCLIIPGLTVIWTAHRTRTAKETFTALKAMAAKEEVKGHVPRVVNTRGEEGLYFTNGSRILFGAREDGFGLGFTNVGVLVLDEGQRLTSKSMDDLIPTMNAAKNPLLLIAGTPPRPTDPGEVFTKLRADSITGESTSTLYIEFSADPNANLDDRDQWRKANVSYPSRTPERAMLRMRRNLSDDSFRREALGIHDEIAADKPVVSKALWTTLIDAGPTDGTAPLAFGLDMSHRRQISITAGWMSYDPELDVDVAHVEEVWAAGTPREAEVWLAERAGRRIPIVVDGISAAASMVPDLRARFMNVKVTSATDMARACGIFENRTVKAPPGVRLLTHTGQESMTKAQNNARKRDIRDAGGWGWDRKDPTKPIQTVVSGTLALLGAVENYRRPREVRKAAY